MSASIMSKVKLLAYTDLSSQAPAAQTQQQTLLPSDVLSLS